MITKTVSVQKESQEFLLVSRFQYCRWSDVRSAIHGLAIGGEVLLPHRKRNSITTSITRLQDAYERTRRYHINMRDNGILVRRSA